MTTNRSGDTRSAAPEEPTREWWEKRCAWYQGEIQRLLDILTQRTNDRDEAMKRVEQWRSWAQFVYLQGGPAIGSDADIQAGVCAAHDKDTQALKAELATLHREQAALVEQTAKVTAAYQALRTEERAVHGPVIITHAGRCGREMNTLMAALDELAALLAAPPTRIP